MILMILKVKKNSFCGGEESFGFMTGDFVRDKDSCGSILLACEIAAWCKAKVKPCINT